MKRWILLITTIALTQSLLAGDPIPGFYNGDVPGVFESARKKNQVIMIDFYTTWCGPCKLLEKNIYRSNSFKALTDIMICYTIDAEKGEGIALAEKYKVRAYPSVVFADAEGREIERKIGYSADVEAYVKDLRRIAEGKDVLPRWMEQYARDSSLAMARKISAYYLQFDSRLAEPYYQKIMVSPAIPASEKKELRLQFARGGLRMRASAAALEAAEGVLAEVIGTPGAVESEIAMAYSQQLLSQDKAKAWTIADTWYRRFDEKMRVEFEDLYRDLKYRSGNSTRDEDMNRVKTLNPKEAGGASEIAEIYAKWNEKVKAENILINWLRDNPDADLDALNSTGWTAFEQKVAIKPFSAAMVKVWDVTPPEKRDAYKADTIANLCFANGDRLNAIRFGEIALQMIPAKSRMRKEFEENVARYKAMP